MIPFCNTTNELPHSGHGGSREAMETASRRWCGRPRHVGFSSCVEGVASKSRGQIRAVAQKPPDSFLLRRTASTGAIEVAGDRVGTGAFCGGRDVAEDSCSLFPVGVFMVNSGELIFARINRPLRNRLEEAIPASHSPTLAALGRTR